MLGCIKMQERPNRSLTSKYFTPNEMYSLTELPDYFSGAGYLMNRDAVFKLIEVKDKVPLLHLDDVFIGQLIKEAGISDQMLPGKVQN